YRYRIAGEVSYQSAELADRIDPTLTLTRWRDFMAQGAAFWRWPSRWLPIQSGCAGVNFQRFVVPLTLATLCVAAVCVWVARSEWSRRREIPWSAVALPVLFLTLAYAPYLALAADKANPFWRTQIFAAAPAASLLAVLGAAADRALHTRGIMLAAVAI